MKRVYKQETLRKEVSQNVQTSIDDWSKPHFDIPHRDIGKHSHLTDLYKKIYFLICEYVFSQTLKTSFHFYNGNKMQVQISRFRDRSWLWSYNFQKNSYVMVCHLIIGKYITTFLINNKNVISFNIGSIK